MKKNKLLLAFVSIIILGGIMGLIKSFIPGMEYFDYRFIITGTSTYGLNEKPIYATIYSVIMALLEISCIMLFFNYHKTIIKYIMIVIIINVIGCIVAIILGDYLAILSLFLRIILLGYTVQVYKGLNLNN
jgi:hypothetical protein